MKKKLILLNMGGAKSPEDMRVFLRNMFSDPNIIPLPTIFRKIIGFIIIKSRLKDAMENIRLIGGKSPLNGTTERLCRKLEPMVGYGVDMAMRYVAPFSLEVLERCKQEGVVKLILFPMYPHYSTTTTKSSLEDIIDVAKSIDYHPEIITIEPYYADLSYNQICVNLIKDKTSGIDRAEYDLIFSAHGLPQNIVDKGDPYEKHIHGQMEAIKLMLEEQDIKFKNIKLAYQSKVGKGKWLQPSLIDTLRRPTSTKIVVFPMSFTIDNSETVFELDIEAREITHKMRYEDMLVCDCPNDSDEFARFVYDKVQYL